MSATRSPWMKFYPADWRADTRLRLCSLTARAVWLELIGLMHESDEYGYLLLSGAPPSNAALSSLLAVHHQTVKAALKELGIHGVYSVDDRGVIYSRRMVRDHAKALQDKENGRRGGNPNIPKGVNPRVNGEDKAHIPEARSQIPEKEETPTLRFGVSPAPALEGELFEPSKPKLKPPRRSSVGLELEMTDAMRGFAAERGFLNGKADAVFEAFKSHHAAKGTTFANLEAGWRTWVLNEIKFNGGRNERTDALGRTRRPASAVEAILSDIGREPRER